MHPICTQKKKLDNLLLLVNNFTCVLSWLHHVLLNPPIGMTRRRGFKPTKFDELILLVVSRCSDITLTKTKLVKFLYLLEWEYFCKFGEKLSEHEFIRIKMGAVPQNYDNTFQRLQRHELSIRTKQIGRHREKIFRVGNRPRFRYEFTEIELETLEEELDELIDRFATQPVEAITTYSYQTPPMKRYLAREEEEGRKKFGGYLFREPFILPEDIDPMAEMRRAYKDHLRTSRSYSKEDSEIDKELLEDLRPFVQATNRLA